MYHRVVVVVSTMSVSRCRLCRSCRSCRSCRILTRLTPIDTHHAYEVSRLALAPGCVEVVSRVSRRCRGGVEEVSRRSVGMCRLTLVSSVSIVSKCQLTPVSRCRAGPQRTPRRPNRPSPGHRQRAWWAAGSRAKPCHCTQEDHLPQEDQAHPAHRPHHRPRSVRH
jgi:hypothetical protein